MSDALWDERPREATAWHVVVDGGISAGRYEAGSEAWDAARRLADEGHRVTVTMIHGETWEVPR